MFDHASRVVVLVVFGSGQVYIWIVLCSVDVDVEDDTGRGLDESGCFG